MSSKLTISNFTDPMMGLSYESEPFLRKVETHFEGLIDFKFVMSGLVRNVYDFVDQADMQFGEEVALKKYNKRLGKIYEAEEGISGMPINMTDLQLFSTEHTSSIPLNLAYKAAQLADPGRADLFLYNLRYATIVECRPTTRFAEILAVVAQTDIDRDVFIQYYNGGRARAALDEDFRLRHELGVRGLPAYLFEYEGKSILLSGVLRYADFVAVIDKLTNGEFKEECPEASLDNVRALVDLHPRISPIEVQAAFDLTDIGAVRTLIQPLLDAGEIKVVEVHHGWFIQKAQLSS